ncbi:MAG: desulfoferrodoxin Dfx [Clostridia bacterium]|nr:desulfoferrodoxin Dfx [Clostridia bacterium]
MKFYKCNICGNVITHVNKEANKVSCCNKEMVELVANTVEASTEKHIPVYNVIGNEVFVKVGEVTHPMLNEHYITTICVETDKGVYIKKLLPNLPPEASFKIADNEKIIAVYEYCNLHGLWKA